MTPPKQNLWFRRRRKPGRGRSLFGVPICRAKWNIMNMAGGLDDRWLRGKAGLKPSTTTGREESPDTALRQQRNALSESSKRMGNAPGNARGAVAQTLVCVS